MYGWGFRAPFLGLVHKLDVRRLLHQCHPGCVRGRSRKLHPPWPSVGDALRSTVERPPVASLGSWADYLVAA
eukprot:12334994-Alexandrium_andersonii.AAC.1